jgi:hypothetical protein
MFRLPSFALLLVAAVNSASAVADDSKPNIILIMADDK